MYTHTPTFTRLTINQWQYIQISFTSDSVLTCNQILLYLSVSKLQNVLPHNDNHLCVWSNSCLPFQILQIKFSCAVRTINQDHENPKTPKKIRRSSSQTHMSSFCEVCLLTFNITCSMCFTIIPGGKTVFMHFHYLLMQLKSKVVRW